MNVCLGAGVVFVLLGERPGTKTIPTGFIFRLFDSWVDLLNALKTRLSFHQNDDISGRNSCMTPIRRRFIAVVGYCYVNYADTWLIKSKMIIEAQQIDGL